MEVSTLASAEQIQKFCYKELWFSGNWALLIRHLQAEGGLPPTFPLPPPQKPATQYSRLSCFLNLQSRNITTGQFMLCLNI